MRVLTLWQPWASLIALGVKTIETRPMPAPRSLIGERIAIHAAATPQGFWALPGDCEGDTEAGWVYGYVGDYQASYCYRSSDEGQRGDTWMVKYDGACPAPDFDGPLPMGAIVCTAVLADSVPMVDFETWHKMSLPRVELINESLWLRATADMWGQARNITDQLPYGHFAPGRWAYLLTDVEPLNVPVPFKGGQGWTRTWEPNDA